MMTSDKIENTSGAILAEFAKQGSVRGAIDKVLGAGVFDAIASDLYDQLRVQQVKA